MKKTIATIALAMAAALAASAAAEGTFGVRTMSYNIRCEIDADTGDTAWNARRKALCDFVKEVDPDVIGFQEVSPNQMAYLKSQLTDYEIFGKHRWADNTQLATPVAYKKSRFALLDGGTFWLSTTPDVQGSMSLPGGNTGSDPETCSWALLKDRTTGGVFCFFSTHLDWKQPVCRKLQMEIAVERVMRYVDNAVPTFIMGDLNARWWENTIAEVACSNLNNACLISSTTPTGPWRTFNGWEYLSGDDEPSYEAQFNLPSAERNPTPVDYILTSRDIAVDAFAIRNDTQPGKEQYPSDHFPVVAELVMPCDNDLFTGKVRVEFTKSIPYVGAGRFVLTDGANLVNDDNLEFDLPEWILRAGVEDGEIVIYTKPKPFCIHVR